MRSAHMRGCTRVWVHGHLVIKAVLYLAEWNASTMYYLLDARSLATFTGKKCSTSQWLLAPVVVVEPRSHESRDFSCPLDLFLLAKQISTSHGRFKQQPMRSLADA